MTISKLDMVLVTKIKKAFSDHDYAPRSRYELGVWLWPGSNWDHTRRIARAIRMTQDHAQELGGCVTYIAPKCCYVWLSQTENQAAFKQRLLQNSVAGAIHQLKGELQKSKTSSFIFHTLADKPETLPKTRRELNKAADLCDFKTKAISSIIDDLREIA